MAERVKHIRHATAQAALFEGLEGEITIDLTKKTAIVHDSVNPGGNPLARADLDNVASATTSTSGKMSATHAQVLNTAVSTNTTQDGRLDAIDIEQATQNGRLTSNEGAIGQNQLDIAANSIALAAKADLTIPATPNNLAELNAAGNLQDSGVQLSELVDSSLFTTGMPAFPNAVSYVGPVQFSVVGDYTALFHADRLVEITDASKTFIDSVQAAAYASGVTTVQISGAGGYAIDTSIAGLRYGVFADTHTVNAAAMGRITGTASIAAASATETYIDIAHGYLGSHVFGATCYMQSVGNEAYVSVILLASGYQSLLVPGGAALYYFSSHTYPPSAGILRIGAYQNLSTTQTVLVKWWLQPQF